MSRKMSEFLMTMSERQITAREFFSTFLLDALEESFGLKNVLILIYDHDNNFLSWILRDGLQLGGSDNPYTAFCGGDIMRYYVYNEAVHENLNYFNMEPKIYYADSVIEKEDYESSSYVRFFNENFGMHYVATLAMGINAYIRILVMKSKEDGEFSPQEKEELSDIYRFIANSYKNFKKHEQTKIISEIKTKIIADGGEGYIITDEFSHVMAYNSVAIKYLSELLGDATLGDPADWEEWGWLPYTVSRSGKFSEVGYTHRKTRGFIIKAATFGQSYSHRIVDKYHWITISRDKADTAKAAAPQSAGASYGYKASLTRAETKVSEYLLQGLTYKDIADKLCVSYHTVKNHVQNIYAKCGVKNRYQLSSYLEDTSS